MNAAAGRSVARIAGVAVLAMIVGAIATIGASVVLDRFEQTEIRITGVTPEPIVAHVGGAVATPGIYTLPAGARLVDAVVAAGGLRDDADPGSINLASRIGDGESIAIPAVVPVNSASPAPVASSSARVNINAADKTQLETLPGIGPVLAERIIAEREQHGAFQSVDDLARVDGISDSTIEELQPLVTTGD